MVCGGSGLAMENRFYKVQFPVGAADGHRLRVVGEGDVADDSSRPGDLIFVSKTNPHEIFERIEGRPLDVRTRFESGLDRIRSGFSMTIERLGGKDMGFVTVEVPPDLEIQPGQQKIVRVKQFTEAGGDLDVMITITEQVWVF